MEIEYIPETHTYLLDGVAVPSVTQIVNWYLGEPYKEVPKAVLEKAARYGTGVHEAIEEYEKTGVIIEEHIREVTQWIRLNTSVEIEVDNMEQIVFSEIGYAGRYDMKGTVNGRPALLDLKTTSKLNKESLALQMGLYKMALGEDLECYCVWMPKTGDIHLVPIEEFSRYDCEAIVKSFLRGETKPTINETKNNVVIYTQDEIKQIQDFMRLKAKVDKIEKDGKERAMSFMREHGVKTFENDFFKITYIEPTEKKTVDTDKMKDDGIYDEYVKSVPVKESVRITWRNQS